MGLLVSYSRLWLGQALSVVGWVKGDFSQAPCPNIMAKACIFMRQCT